MRKIVSLVVTSVWKRFTLLTTIAVILGMWSEGTHTNVAHGAAPPLTIGFIYVGPQDDYGYNQAHAQGAAVWPRCPA